MQHILLCTDGSTFSKVCYEYTAWFAKRLDARVEILYVSNRQLDPILQKRDLTGRLGIAAYTEALDRTVQHERDDAQLERERAMFVLREAETFFRNSGLDDTIAIHRTGILADSFHEFETECDLIALGKHGQVTEFASDRLGKNMEQVVRAAAKPCLVTPREFQPIENVLLVYDGSPSCRAALDFICCSRVFAGLRLHAIATERSDRETAATVQLAADAAAALANAGFAPITDLLHGEMDAQVERYATAHEIDLMLVGSYGHHRWLELLMGNPTAQLLKHSQIPMLMFP